jgi:hypothetical protein
MSDMQVDTSDQARVQPPVANDIVGLHSVQINPGLQVTDQVEYKWVVEDWVNVKKQEKVYSPEFKCGDITWY